MQDSPLSDIRIGQVTAQWAKAQKISSQYFPKIDSTNLKAKTEAFSEEAFNEHLILYVTDHQTAGRGRGQNTWSDAGSGSQLLSTWSFMLEQALHPTAAPMMGLALYRAAVATWPFLEWNLKAPNDLYIGNKKVAGLLLESLSQGSDHRLLVGLGLNVISSPENVSTATSLVHELPESVPLLAEDWIAFLERLVFEMSFSLQLAHEAMNSTSTQALLHALNKHPLLKEQYTALDQNGNLSTPSKQISWMEL
ncbi:biotin--[acetyl-CoA-carboxylase] ligase [Pseudobdellovibrio exovorus]|uniref:Biotin--synthetase n=1 Tax=Pseudobdellovibrio exovorus JSS TaxID=1184267 RepID=M4VS81_9BACT|nr:biotin--synthetase [Pseudobdellovibrio exovorus]AGH96044.1 biotin--synthetase [Pseudobdellovibrio exovorus JSS]